MTASQHGNVSRPSTSLRGNHATWLGFLDQLTEWERRVQEYEGESLETFSDGIKFAVLASRAPESQSEMWSDWQQVRQTATVVQCARTCQRFFSLAESSTRMVEEWSRNPAVRTRRRWTLMVLAKARRKGCFVCGRPGHAAKDCKFNQAKGKGQGKGKTKSTSTEKNTPAKIVGERRFCGKKGHKWALLPEASGRSERQESPRRWWNVDCNGGGSGRHRGDR